MKAIVQERYGSPDLLELREIDRPVVGADDVLVRVRAASITVADWRIVRGSPPFMRMATGLRRPKEPVPGTDVAGEVEAVGSERHVAPTGRCGVRLVPRRARRVRLRA